MWSFNLKLLSSADNVREGDIAVIQDIMNVNLIGWVSSYSKSVKGFKVDLLTIRQSD